MDFIISPEEIINEKYNSMKTSPCCAIELGRTSCC